jgi:hypothetical protein
VNARLYGLAVLVLALSAMGCAAGDAVRTRVDLGGEGDAAVDSGVRDAGRVDAGARQDLGSDGGATVDAAVEDTGVFVDAGALADAGESLDAFVAEDAGSPLDAGTPLDAGPPDAGAPDAGRDAGPPPTPSPGTYLYRRIPVGGMKDASRVAFHPDGTYALVLESYDFVLVYDWASETVTRIDLSAGAGNLYLTDVVFDPSGGFALITGYDRVTTTDTGALLAFDDATYRGGSPATAVTRLTDTRAGERFMAITYPPPGDGPAGDGRPVVLSASGTTSYIARLRELELGTRTFAGLVEARPTSAGCDDLAFADNEFGGWGIAVVCGSGGADAAYYTQIAGVGEWRAGPTATLGNTSRASSYPSGAYALAIGWSGRRVHRFEAGAWNTTASVPWFTTMSIWDVSFSADGRRALIVGGAGATPLRAAVLEYRHNLYSAAAITDASIAGFDAAPYLGDTSTFLRASAFRPGCDGGLIVGGKTTYAGSTGLLIEFTIEGGTACP